MSLLRAIVLRWAPLAALATAVCVLIYLGVQQVGRHLANDPQLEMARDIGARLAAGEPVSAVVPATPVDFGRSLSPFVTIYDEAGAVVATSGRLNGSPRILPPGVLDHVRQNGEERVTWQPEPGVRIATVIVRREGASRGFVLAGRSLRETEERTAKFGSLIAAAWIAVVGGLFVLVSMSEYLLAHPRAA